MPEVPVGGRSTPPFTRRWPVLGRRNWPVFSPPPTAGEGRRYKPLELKVAVAKAYVAGEATAAELSKVYGVSASTIYDCATLYKERGEGPGGNAGNTVGSIGRNDRT